MSPPNITVIGHLYKKHQ